ncbi:MAG: hypothetical protein J0M19_07050 [Sphingomonadales bacterium]|nr:hypothetical protein [Sphingomonadales bacterium]
MKKVLFAAAVPLALLGAATAQAQSQPAQLSDLECTVRVMKVLSGTLTELKKPDLTAENRDQSMKLRSRSERSLAYFIGRLDMGPANPKLNEEIVAKWTAAGKLSIDDQTVQTMECLKRSDDAQMAFLRSAGGS